MCWFWHKIFTNMPMKNQFSQPNGVENGSNMSESVPNMKINYQKHILDLYEFSKWSTRGVKFYPPKSNISVWNSHITPSGQVNLGGVKSYPLVLHLLKFGKFWFVVRIEIKGQRDQRSNRSTFSKIKDQKDQLLQGQRLLDVLRNFFFPTRVQKKCSFSKDFFGSRTTFRNERNGTKGAKGRGVWSGGLWSPKRRPGSPLGWPKRRT